MTSLFGKPFILSIGPQKSGARWIHAYLSQRGDVCLPGVRETFYFDRHFQRGPAFYTSHFSPGNQHVLVMEITTTAFDAPEAAHYAHDLLGPEIGLLCPLRDPVARAREIYFDYLEYGLVQGSVAEAVEQAPQILLSSRYTDHLERWAARFGRERLRVVFHEVLERSAEEYAQNLCEALWLPYRAPVSLPPHEGQPVAAAGAQARGLTGLIDRVGRRRASAPRERVLGADDAAWLKDRLYRETARLEQFLGHKIPAWNRE